jgi:predicted metal-dependent hydrolase
MVIFPLTAARIFPIRSIRGVNVEVTTLQIGKYTVEVEYRRIKAMRLTVYPDGRIKIAVPLHTNQAAIETFVSSKTQWIEKHQTKFQKRLPSQNQSFKVGEIHFVWGIPCKLEIIERSGHPKMWTENGKLIMSIKPETTKLQKIALLDKFYRNLLAEAAPQFVKKWEPIINVKINKIFYRKMTSCWGSCNYTKGTLRLNTELAKKHPEYLEYVVIHEMIHIHEPSHNKHFYELMNTFYPNWKTIRKKMNGIDTD